MRDRLASIEARVVAGADAFREAALAAMLHAIPPEKDIGGIVSTDEMSNVYTQRMAKKGSPGRPIYDKLLAAPAHGRVHCADSAQCLPSIIICQRHATQH